MPSFLTNQSLDFSLSSEEEEVKKEDDDEEKDGINKIKTRQDIRPEVAASKPKSESVMVGPMDQLMSD